LPLASFPAHIHPSQLPREKLQLGQIVRAAKAAKLPGQIEEPLAGDSLVLVDDDRREEGAAQLVLVGRDLAQDLREAVAVRGTFQIEAGQGSDVAVGDELASAGGFDQLVIDDLIHECLPLLDCASSFLDGCFANIPHLRVTLVGTLPVQFAFSLKEAAAIADIPERSVRKALEATAIRPENVSAGRAPRNRFSARDLLYLKLITDFPFALPATDKRAFQDLFEAKCPASGRWYTSNGNLVVESNQVVLRVELKQVRRTIARRLQVFRRGRRRIVSTLDILSRVPVFQGTRIPLSHIAGLFAKGISLDEIREDYPSLSAEDLEFAALVTRMKPNPGRRREPLVLIRDGQPIITRDRYVDHRETVAR
jgi:uncharacterized protein (DUF433 family)